MVSNQGYVRTVEAVIAIVITFTLLNVLIDPSPTTSTRRAAEDVLPALRGDVQFRVCVQLKNTTCINDTLTREIPENYYFSFNLSDDEKGQATGLPQKRVFASSLYVKGNQTNSTTTVLRVFYWSKE